MKTGFVLETNVDWDDESEVVVAGSTTGAATANVLFPVVGATVSVSIGLGAVSGRSAKTIPTKRSAHKTVANAPAYIGLASNIERIRDNQGTSTSTRSNVPNILVLSPERMRDMTSLEKFSK